MTVTLCVGRITAERQRWVAVFRLIVSLPERRNEVLSCAIAYVSAPIHFTISGAFNGKWFQWTLNEYAVHQTTCKTGCKRHNLIIGASWATDDNEYKEIQEQHDGLISHSEVSKLFDISRRQNTDAATVCAIVFRVKLSCKYAFEVAPVTVSLFDVTTIKLKNSSCTPEQGEKCTLPAMTRVVVDKLMSTVEEITGEYIYCNMPITIDRRLIHWRSGENTTPISIPIPTTNCSWKLVSVNKINIYKLQIRLADLICESSWAFAQRQLHSINANFNKYMPSALAKKIMRLVVLVISVRASIRLFPL